jgi:hypothetical protein
MPFTQVVESHLNICTWNVGGMIYDGLLKSSDNLFIKNVKDHDLVLTETHIYWNRWFYVLSYM